MRDSRRPISDVSTNIPIKPNGSVLMRLSSFARDFSEVSKHSLHNPVVLMWRESERERKRAREIKKKI